MDFSLTTEQKMIQTLAKEFREKEIDPIAGQMDKDGKIPPDIRKRLADAGLAEMTTSTEYGGPGADEVSQSLVLEEIPRIYVRGWPMLALRR